jgi:hypothetical protein
VVDILQRNAVVLSAILLTFSGSTLESKVFVSLAPEVKDPFFTRRKNLEPNSVRAVLVERMVDIEETPVT